MLLTARNKIDPTHRIRSTARKWVAADSESPIPVQTATYAARDIGHFGSNTSTRAGDNPTGYLAASARDVAAARNSHAYTSAAPHAQFEDSGDAVGGQ